MGYEMTWGDMIEFLQGKPELMDKPARLLNYETDALYAIDFVEFVEPNDLLPVGEVAITASVP